MVEHECPLQLLRRMHVFRWSFRQLSLVRPIGPLSLGVVAGMRSLGIGLEYGSFTHHTRWALLQLSCVRIKWESQKFEIFSAGFITPVPLAPPHPPVPLVTLARPTHKTRLASSKLYTEGY